MAQRYKIEDVNISGYNSLITPRQLKAEVPLTRAAAETVGRSRETIRDILRGDDARFMLIVGPCSVHDPEAYRDYADRLNELRQRVDDAFVVVMRSYFEKPRTTMGWKGLIDDPLSVGAGGIDDGLFIARELLAYSAGIGLPSATEFVHRDTGAFISDLVSWVAVGARDVESSGHRYMASGLSMPVGFKNNTDGNMQVAVDAVNTARHPHSFRATDQDGRTVRFNTLGNEFTHVVLRGGTSGSNYDEDSIRRVQEMLLKIIPPLRPNVVIDANHGQSNKDPAKQPGIVEDVMRQRRDGNEFIVGAMVESNIEGGRQDIPEDPKTLVYGQSVTDACLGFDATESMVMELYKSVARQAA